MPSARSVLRLALRRVPISTLIRGLIFTAPLSASAQTAADSASVAKFYGEWFGAVRQGPATYASYYASDGMVLPPNTPPAVGREAIAEWLRQAQATSPCTVRPEGIAVDELRFLGPMWVVYRSTLRGQRVPKVGGDPVPFETKYVDLLHRTESVAGKSPTECGATTGRRQSSTPSRSGSCTVPSPYLQTP